MNFQHDFLKSEFLPPGLPQGLKVEQFHDSMSIHAADGALPMLMACVHPADQRYRNAWFTTDGNAAETVAQAAYLADPRRVTADASRTGQDPLLEEGWPREMREDAWAQLTEWTGATWDLAGAGSL